MSCRGVTQTMPIVLVVWFLLYCWNPTTALGHRLLQQQSDNRANNSSHDTSNQSSSLRMQWAPDEQVLEGHYVIVFRPDSVPDDETQDGLLNELWQNVNGSQPRMGLVFRSTFRGAQFYLPDDDDDDDDVNPTPVSTSTAFSSAANSSILSTLQQRRQQRQNKLQNWLDHPSVQWIEEGQVISIQAADQKNPPSWGLDRIDQASDVLDGNYYYDQTGQGVTVFVVDTGVLLTHDDFGGRVTCGYDAFDLSGSSKCIDQDGHGTHVTGTIGGKTYGVAKHVSLVAVKVLNNSGEGSTGTLLQGLEYVAKQASAAHGSGARYIANLSLGGSRSLTLNLAAATVTSYGVLFVAAAGNSDMSACLTSPAGSSSVLAVGAIDETDYRANFSNYGGCVDIFAPGSNIVSTWNTNDQATNILSGTSMSSPHVAGAAALYWQRYPNLTASELRRQLLADALPNVVTDAQGSANLLVNTMTLLGNASNTTDFFASSATRLFTRQSDLRWGLIYVDLSMSIRLLLTLSAFLATL